MVANSAALEHAGIRAETPDPAGGRIGRLPGRAEPDGILYEMPAMTMATRHIPAGIRPLLHSDCPVTPVNSLFCMQSAVSRLTSSRQVLNAPERILVQETIEVAATVVGGQVMYQTEAVGLD